MNFRYPACALVLLVTLAPPDAFAAPAAGEGSGEAEGSGEGEGSGFDWDALDGSGDYTSETVADEEPHPGRAASRVERADIERRLPRSTPDALRYEPGVYVQQTAQSQASPYIRGRTGQQTVLMFDGVRLNNSLFRQGPNQYFFTVDSATVDHIDVLRGSASTTHGSDAIAGAIEAVPIEPTRDVFVDGFAVTPRLMLDADSASSGYGGRAQFDMQLGPNVGLVGGVGARRMGLLRGGGAVRSPDTGALPEVPRLDDDGKTQLGTGFDEVTSDARLVVRVADDLDLVAAAYNYRQIDAPRTDQCAPPFAPFDECLQYDEQFRTVAYAGLDGDAGPVRDLELRLSWQRQHELRTHDRPGSFTVNSGRDDVDTFGFRAVAHTPEFMLGRRGVLQLQYGGDLYHDRVRSRAWLSFSDVDVVRERSRGQYLDGSTYTWGGAFVQAEVEVVERVTFRGGGRLAGAGANAPGDPESGTEAVDNTWLSAVGNAGVEVEVTESLTVVGGVDQGFRAPNLDDLTSRQQTGPGYQLENPDLVPERALTVEGGVRLRHRGVAFDVWGYRMTLRDAISRASRTAADCPDSNLGCRNSWSVLQLVNVDGTAVIRGVEAIARVDLPHGIWLRSTIAWARGDEPAPSGDGGRQPVSRVPPLNGTGEVGWEHDSGVWLGGAVRWATLQDRLSVGDVSDERILVGGTPGYAVVDLRAGYRFDPWFSAAVVAENLGDAAYRTHGSSVNGAGRSVIAHIEVSPGRLGSRRR